MTEEPPGATVVILHSCPLCGGSLRPPWDPATEPWKCRGCGSGIDLADIGVAKVTEKFRPR